MASKSPSYAKIDYSLRPAKAIERKMLIDLLRRLDRVASLNHYRYVGFGSPYFADFNLFHRALGICDLVSIEKEVGDEPRFRFNAPFGAVQLKFGESAEILPEMQWSQRSVVWLDYDERLDESKLDDIAFLVRNLAGGSILVVSVNAHPYDQIETRLDDMRSDLGSYLPRRYTSESLGGWGTAAAAREVIDERIRTALLERNTGQSQSASMDYRQLINFHYRDGARMLTVGGVVYDAGQQAGLRGCAFEDFEFYREGSDAYELFVPRLTLKEMRYLDTQLPSDAPLDLDEIGIPAGDAMRYAKLYRYFPKYVDTEI